ncbi:hypothetical protein CERZMDRAFT_85234 [Cercospora zeae-maydis SCOH1-5]|uniref:Uncharacterized protein n=1 Tax=Cercospora zeae-maydis SCOH1-5 TaxID=717836 RepID=A0A6A6FF32_9PEZI|nr:hypothetical protein CERZMDRAFT_85234 [Cercospora zeae-maydis SCOH1-5]
MDDHVDGDRVIVWDTAQFVPIPAAVQHPAFIADIPGWCNDNVPPDMTFEDDRTYLEGAIRKLATESASYRMLPNLLGTSRERQFFELSLRNKRINEQYVKLRLGSVLERRVVPE